MAGQTRFEGGVNIAMKVPPHEHAATVAFYRDVLGLEVIRDDPSPPIPSVGFAFGPNTLWIDRVAHATQAEVWLELRTDSTEAADAALAAGGVVRCDPVEPLPAGLDAFWVTNPAGVVHLVKAADRP